MKVLRISCRLGLLLLPLLALPALAQPILYSSADLMWPNPDGSAGFTLYSSWDSESYSGSCVPCDGTVCSWVSPDYTGYCTDYSYFDPGCAPQICQNAANQIQQQLYVSYRKVPGVVGDAVGTVVPAPSCSTFPSLLCNVTVYGGTASTILPSVYVGSIYYMPPGGTGNYTSYADYSSTSDTKVVNSLTGSWQVSSAVPSVVPVFGGAGVTAAGYTTTTFTTDNSHTAGMIAKGAGLDAIDHTIDQVELFMCIKVKLYHDLNGYSYQVDFSDSAEQRVYVKNLLLGLETSWGEDDNQRASLLSPQDSSGQPCQPITDGDIEAVLNVYPFYGGRASDGSPVWKSLSQVDPARFLYLGSVGYAPQPSSQTIPYDRLSCSNGSSTKVGNSFSINMNVSSNLGVFTFGQSSYLETTDTDTHSAKLYLYGPTTNDTPSELFVYYDTLYQTFMFTFDTASAANSFSICPVPPSSQQ